MLNTSLSDLDRYPLKISDLIVMNLNPIMAPIKIIWAPSPDRVINDVQTIALAGDKYYLPMWVSNELEEYTRVLSWRSTPQDVVLTKQGMLS